MPATKSNKSKSAYANDGIQELDVDLSGSPQRLLNFALDLDRWNLRPDLNVIDDTLDAAHARDRFFRPLKLVVPLDLAFERDQSVLDDDPYPLPG